MTTAAAAAATRKLESIFGPSEVEIFLAANAHVVLRKGLLRAPVGRELETIEAVWTDLLLLPYPVVEFVRSVWFWYGKWPTGTDVGVLVARVSLADPPKGA